VDLAELSLHEVAMSFADSPVLFVSCVMQFSLGFRVADLVQSAEY
jgi:hypothetical protein